jgi:hypothetical protein
LRQIPGFKGADDSIGKYEKRMEIKPMRRRYLIFAAIVAFAMLLVGSAIVAAQEDVKSPKSSEQQSPRPDEQETIKGYPVRERQVGGPTDVEWDHEPRSNHFQGSEVQDHSILEFGF